MSMQMLKTKIKSLGSSPMGDTEDALRRQLAEIEQPKPDEKEPEKTEPEKTETVEPVETEGSIKPFELPESPETVTVNQGDTDVKKE